MEKRYLNHGSFSSLPSEAFRRQHSYPLVAG
jgi:hypothetical protein